MNLSYLTEMEKEKLLKIARETLTAHFTNKEPPSYTLTNAHLLEDGSAFVTLWQKNGELRGCVGRINATTPLYHTVQGCVISSATQDRRFNPVEADELDELVIEISVLSPFEEINGPEDIEIGRHGLFIRQQEPVLKSGLLLPEVASKRNWTPLEFLDAVCRKASLPLNAWQKATLYRFETQIFEE